MNNLVNWLCTVIRKGDAEIAEKIAEEAKVERAIQPVSYPPGLRIRVMDDRFLTEAGRAATKDGLLEVDKLSL